MGEETEIRQTAPPDGGPSVRLGELEAALQRNIEPLLDQLKQAVKQAALGAIEEVVRKYGAGFADEVRQTLRAAVDDLVKAQVGRLVAELAPTGDTARKLADGLHQELQDFANTTLRNLFETRLPVYSRWAGRSLIDYALAGLFFATAAVLLCVGSVLALQQTGLPPYVTYFVCGVGALGLGTVFLALRRREQGPPPGDQTCAGPPGAG